MGGLYINHFGAVRLRVNGSGSLLLKLISLDTSIEQILTPVTMSLTTGRYPNQLANFNQQRAQLEFRVSALNETFTLRQILIYSKPIAESFPQ